MVKQFNFIAINIFSSGILFFRSLLFLKYLPDNDLGLVMIFQAVIALLGLAQIGLFNGGLRIFSIDKEKPNYETVNNTNITFSSLITILFIIVTFFGYFVFKFNLAIFIIAAVSGGFELLKNWFSNLLIARKKLREINYLNFTSAFVSALLAITIFSWGVYGALISISSSYIFFVLLFIIKQKEYRLTKISINWASLKKMLKFGFVPFLSGIAVLLNNQIDRFFIVETISLDALGQFYLATTFLSIFNLLPANLNSLFLPTAINCYTEKQFHKTFRITKKYFLILLSYSCLSLLLLFFFGEMVVNLIFPEKIDQLKYLFIMLPGIFAITLSQPFGFLLYVVLNLKAIFWSNVFSLISYLGILISLVLFSIFTIENVAYGKAIQGVLVFLFLMIATLLSIKKAKCYYFVND